MKIIYTPGDGDEQTWHWTFEDVRARDAEQIEAKADCTWDQFQMQLLNGQMRARRVLLWHLQRQTHPQLKFADVDFVAKELMLEFDLPELEKFRDGVLQMSGISDEQREAALAFIDKELADKRAELEAAGDGAGKALSVPSASSTL